MPPAKVKSHTHVTPEVYLRRFATDGLLVAQRPGEEPQLLGTPVVAVRKRFYTLRTVSGTGDNQVEDSLSVLESTVSHIFRRVDNRELPLDTEAKAMLAEFIATQICRGVAYRRMRGERFDDHVPFLREKVRDIFRAHAPGRLDEAEDYDITRVLDHNPTVRASIETGQAMTNVLVNMRWQFVQWRRPVLLSGDQPAICWHAPHQSSPWGPLAAAEIRMPLAPDLAFVATWHDGPDPGDVPEVSGLAAMSMNHHTQRQAVDWLYWKPETKPQLGMPLNDGPIYYAPPERSVRRQLVSDHLAKLLESREAEITVFTPK